MLCQVCNKNTATIHYKSAINGNTTEKYLCPECAEKAGIGKKTFKSTDSFFNVADDDIFGSLFAGMMNDSVKKSASTPSVCPMCGMRFSEFLHGGKIGCSKCYETFSASLYPTIKRIHSSAEHMGKIPQGLDKEMSDKKKIELLKSKLNEAIEKQEYEMAAKYRDEIRAIENEGKEEK